MRQQWEPVPFNRRVGRHGNAPGGAVAAQHRFTAGGQSAELEGDPRYFGATQDDGIRRDRTAWFSHSVRSGVGTVAVDWTAAGPPRPELHMRNVTVRTMAGTSRTRALASPYDPQLGLHSKTPGNQVRGNASRAAAGTPIMKHGRTDRLSPARYSGQSYSQTTLEQGARRR